MAAEGPPPRPDQYDRARSGGAGRGAVGGLLGEPEGGRDPGERHRDPGFLSDQGAVPPQGQIPGDPGFLRRLLYRGEEARAARHRAHEPGPELGRRRPGAPGMVPAGRAGQSRAPYRRSQAVPDVHVHHLHDGLHAGHYGGGQLAVRRGRPVHQRLAAAGEPAGLSLRAVPEAAASGNAGVLGEVQRADHLSVEALRLHRQKEEALEFLFCQSRRGHPLHRQPGATGRTLRVVPVRQPGPRRRSRAHLGMLVAGAGLPRRAEGQDGHQRDGGVVHWPAPLAQRLQVARRTADVVQRDAGFRDGALPPHHRRRARHGRRPPLAGAGAPVLQLDGAARPALRQQAVDRQRGGRDGAARAPVLSAAAGHADGAIHGRHVLRPAGGPVPVRFRA